MKLGGVHQSHVCMLPGILFLTESLTLNKFGDIQVSGIVMIREPA